MEATARNHPRIMAHVERNWAGNYTYAAARLYHPATLHEVRELVRNSRAIRVLGSRHSFNGIADSTEDLVSLSRLDQVVDLDRDRRTVTIQGGMRYGQLGQFLHANGFALPNLASLPHISVAGACATATHGSGEGSGNLATSVVAMDILSPDGDVISLSRATHAEFDGMVVSLGALGVIVGMTLDVVPTFNVRQDVYEHLSLEAVAQGFDAIQESAYSVSLFTNWTHECFDQLWLKRVGDVDELGDIFHGARRAPENRHPIAGISAQSCTPQMSDAGAWHDRLPHFRMEFTPSSGEELQSEYFVPRRYAVDALRAMMQLGHRIAPLLLVSEVRTIAADTLWLSPCYEQSTMALHFTWKPDWNAVRALIPDIESALAPFAARPHWGKLFTMAPAEVSARYRRMADFKRLLLAYDPAGKFRNAFVESFLAGIIPTDQ
ncbi:MAG: FAD-binding protein [Gemmatimonadetes bacterium]|nr:FAD-binding protein [Gemmatimonadota bacterium]